MPDRIASSPAYDIAADTETTFVDTVTAAPSPVADATPIRELESRLTELAGHLNAATHRWLMLLAEFDRREGWGDGFTHSCAHWLSWKLGIDRGAAREKVRVARALEALPAIGAAMAEGRLSYSKVRALTRVATAATEADLLMIALHGTADHVERVVRGVRRVRSVELSTEASQQAGRSLNWHHDDDGSVVLRVRLAAETGLLVLRALEAVERSDRDARARDDAMARDRGAAQETGKDVSAETRDGVPDARAQPACVAERARVVEPADTPTQRRADALVRLAESWLAGGEHALAGGERQQIIVHVDAAVLRAGVPAIGAAEADAVEADTAGPDTAEGSGGHSPEPGRCELDDGPSLAAETARRLACDASRVTIVEDADGRVLDVGRRSRTVPAAIGRALRSRDAGCRDPGCTHRHQVDAHHIRHWADGGRTSLANLVLLCRRHHRQVHEGGVEAQHRSDGTLRFVDASGREIEAAPPTAGAFEMLLAANRAQALRIDAETATGRWCGERLDLDVAVEGLVRKQMRAEARPHAS